MRKTVIEYTIYLSSAQGESSSIDINVSCYQDVLITLMTTYYYINFCEGHDAVSVEGLENYDCIWCVLGTRSVYL